MHAFNNDTGGSYNEGAAVTAWQQTVEWFNTHLH
jgi:dienelactone hydrolase